MGRMSKEEFRARCAHAKWIATAEVLPPMTVAEVWRMQQLRRQEMKRAELRRIDPGPQKELPNV